MIREVTKFGVLYMLYCVHYNICTVQVCAGPCTDHDGEWLCSYAQWKTEGTEVRPLEKYTKIYMTALKIDFKTLSGEETEKS